MTCRTTRSRRRSARARRLHDRPRLPAFDVHPKEDHLMTVSPDLDLRFREAASTLGLIDIGYDLVESPIGELLVATRSRRRLDLVRPRPGRGLRTARPPGGPRVSAPRAAPTELRRELDEYFATTTHFRPRPRSARAASVHARGPRRARTRSPTARRRRTARAGAADRPPSGRACRRNRDEPQPHPDRPSLPSRRRREREPHRLRGRPRPQGDIARTRRRTLVATAGRWSQRELEEVVPRLGMHGSALRPALPVARQGSCATGISVSGTALGIDVRVFRSNLCQALSPRIRRNIPRRVPRGSRADRGRSRVARARASIRRSRFRCVRWNRSSRSIAHAVSAC